MEDARSTDRLFRSFLRRPTRRRLERVVRQFYGFVYQAALGATRNTDDAEDTVQEVFLSLILRPPAGGSVRSPRGFLAYRVISAVQRLERAGRRRHRREVRAAREIASEQSVAGPDLERVLRAVSELPKELRTTVELRYLMGLRNREIAEALDSSERTVERVLQRARGRLKEQLGKVTLGALIVPRGTELNAATPSAQFLENLTRVLELGSSISDVAVSGALKASVGAGVMKAKTSILGAVAIVGALVIGTMVLRDGADQAETERAETVAETPSSAPPLGQTEVRRVATADEAPDVRSSPDVEPQPTVVFGSVWKEGRREAASGARVFLYGMKVTDDGQAYVQSVREAVAEKDGSFRFSEVNDPVVRVVAWHGPHISYRRDAELELIHLAENTDNGPHDLVLLPGLVVTGVVRDRDTGEPIPGALVKAGRQRDRYGNVDDRETITDSAGAYRLEGLPEGNVDVVADADGYAKVVSMTAMSVDNPTYLDFDLERAIECLVTVTHEDSGPVADVEVLKYLDHPDGGWSFVDERKRTDAEGSVLFSDISRSDETLFRVEHEGYERYMRSFRPASNDGATRVEFSIVLKRPPEKKTRAFVGRVTDRRGKAISGARIYWSKNHSPTDTENVTVTDGSGEFYLSFETDERYFEMVLSVVAEGWASVSKERLQPGTESQPRRVDFVLEPGHWLEGQVVSRDGTPLPGVRIRVKPTGREDKGTIFTFQPVVAGQSTWIKSDGEGRFSCQDLPGPEVYLDLMKKDYSSLANFRAEVDAAVRIVLDGLGTYRGRVVDADTGEPIPEFNVRTTLDSGSQEKGQFFSNEDGHFEISEISVNETFDVLVSAVGRGSAAAHRVAATAPGERAEEPVFRLSSRRFEGIVRDGASGAPLAGVKVTHVVQDTPVHSWDYLARHWTWTASSLVTGEDGRFEFPDRGIAGGLYFQTAGYAWHAQRRGVSDGVPARWVEVNLEPEAVLAGEWRLDRPCRLSLNAAGLERRVRLEREGPFRIENLTAGELDLHVDADRFDDRREWVIPLQLEAGRETRVRLGPLPGGVSFSGRVVSRLGQPLSRIHVRLKPAFPADYSSVSVTSPGGRFRFEGLVAGRYSLEYGALQPSRSRGALESIELLGDSERDLVALEVIAESEK